MGGMEQLDAILVQRVDQGLESRCLRFPVCIQHRDADENDGVIAMREGQVVGYAARLAAQPFEREDRHALERFGHEQFPPALDRDRFGGNVLAVLDREVGQTEEGPAQGFGRSVTVGDMPGLERSEEHTSELQSLMRISYAVFCLKKKKINHQHITKN